MFDYLFERLSCYIPDSFVGGFTVGIICTLLVVQAVKESGTLVGLICSVYTHRRIRKEQREDEERAEAKEKADEIGTILPIKVKKYQPQRKIKDDLTFD